MPAKIPVGKELVGAITKTMDSRFLKADHLLGHGDIQVTIDRVEYHEKIKFEDEQTKDNVHILYFEGKVLPLVLNKTNAFTITRNLKTNKVAEWKGKSIKLYPEQGNFFGKPGFAVRVRPEFN